jgi:hypothetical protein
MQNSSVKNGGAVSRAEKMFKKEKALAEVTAAWAEYKANQAAALANMARLRALRLSTSKSDGEKGDAKRQSKRKRVALARRNVDAGSKSNKQ